MIYTIDRRFRTTAARTPRVFEIAEAFGLGLSDKEFVVYDNLPVQVDRGDVIYITGQSGSGKSLLLRDLVAQMRSAGLAVADLNEMTLADEPVIELVGRNTTEAADLLSSAGISDAWIYIRKPSELSDGQRYRLKLAKVLEMNVDVWVADEFGAVLDRPTAKAVASSMQKVARRNGKTLLVATTHTDLVDELGPERTITKRFRERVNIKEKQ